MKVEEVQRELASLRDEKQELQDLLRMVNANMTAMRVEQNEETTKLKKLNVIQKTQLKGQYETIIKKQ